MYSVEAAQEEIIDYLEANFTGYKFVEQAVPDIDTVLRDGTKQIISYYAFSFGEIYEGRTKSMVGPWGTDHIMPIRIQAVSSKAANARKMANRLDRFLIGYSPVNTVGSFSKSRIGGALFPIVSSTGATEAYQYATSYSVAVQLADDA